MVVYEALHSMKNRKKIGRSGNMTLKLDISKAYDRVKYIFLKKIMEKLGFGQKWVGLVMQCSSIVQYSVLINRQPGETIILTRWLRQADPLSPYLFILFIESLSNIASLLKIYKNAFGQTLNMQKSCIFFSSNTILAVQKNTIDISGAKKSAKAQKHFGLPLMVGRSTFQERVWRRVNNWNNKFLSQVVNEALIKVV